MKDKVLTCSFRFMSGVQLPPHILEHIRLKKPKNLLQTIFRKLLLYI